MNRLASARTRVAAGILFAAASSFAGTTRPAGDGKVDNPIYSMFAKCRPGSTAAYAVTAVSRNGKRTQTLAFTLKGVTPDAATLTMAFTVPDRPGGQTSEISVPAKMSAEFAWPAPSGREDVTAAGRAFRCRVYVMRGPLPFASYRGDQPRPTADNKLWGSDDVPGGLVKVQSDRDEPDAVGPAHLEMVLTACKAK